ncbi:FxsB family cyclophane-forming radical SAM/SPASM peptide maturase [Jidongwangia harbinensis]|uniref:FxsB family cyclophane-forming radical SAM/SPASM peptide maturase n=1 Tax=Jidongwangia harbinensis TaxID=2878561 RepID=UPI001CDA4488|nr:FxsB family cyclophane-forming radical SAM/SPASM peptide maturase [Jidongwangia harbinensis]MCA2215730.1 FxsB family radical SAM/SPASM domain protein [Jidongwangia harbinensis]
MPGRAGGAAGEAHPLSQFVLKVHGRCDLSCDHCYVYEHADQSWRTKPKIMTPAVALAAARRIAEHAEAWHLTRVRVVLHGGEPLLLGPARMDELISQVRAPIEAVTRLTLMMQTNGVRFNPEMGDVLKRHGVRVGVSLDGDRAANDRHRRFANGAGSYDQVRAALALLRRPEYRELYAGILCTVDVRNSPERVYAALLAERPPQVDFLLPHATWDSPPDRPDGSHTPYADWLSAIHRRWLADGRPMRIRLFDGLYSTAQGGPSGSEQLGADAVDLAVIETDGRYEQADSVKTAYDGAPATGLSVLTHPVDDVSRLRPIAVRQHGLRNLNAVCQSCPVVRQCAGGLYAHRYRTGHGFDNPSVYCPDLRVLIDRTADERSVHHASVKPEEISTADVISQIASGFGDEATIGWLAEQQRSVTRALVSATIDQHGPTSGWAALAEVEAEHPDAVRRVLAHPYVRAWAVGVLRADDPAGMPYLGGLAAAAAVHADVRLETGVRIDRGVVALPTVGTLYWPEAVTAAARITVDRGKLWLTGPGHRTITVDLAQPGTTAAWQPARWITLDGWRVRIEDGDPARDCHGWTPADRLDEHAVGRWRDALTEAWRLIGAELPGYAPALRTGLQVIMPLAPDPAGKQRAATAMDAFGALAATQVGPAELAVLLVHEFQHAKLGALLDLYDLHDRDSDAQLTVGWKPEPRPVEAALQGVYAHAAVADVWRLRARTDPRAADLFAMYHRWTTDAIAALRGTDALTPLGTDFVDRLAATVRSWKS